MTKKVTSIIVSGIFNLVDYNMELPKLKICRTCTICGIADALHLHGYSYRKSDRNTNPYKKSLNPLKIIRCLCKICKRTCLAIPECISPKRWYIWQKQQYVINSRLNGKTWACISAATDISIKTCRRWYHWLNNKFNAHAHILKNVAGNLHQILADCIDFKSFWQKCFAHISLDRAMLLCHQAGVDNP